MLLEHSKYLRVWNKKDPCSVADRILGLLSDITLVPASISANRDFRIMLQITLAD